MMSWTRKLASSAVASMLGLAALGGAAGCQSHAGLSMDWHNWHYDNIYKLRYMRPLVAEHPHDPPQPDPKPDAAAQFRNYPPMYAMYSSGATKAFPNYRLHREKLPQPLNQQYLAPVVEPALFLAQETFAPFWALFLLPGRPVYYEGNEYPPTQTGAAPIPDKPVLRQMW